MTEPDFLAMLSRLTSSHPVALDDDIFGVSEDLAGELLPVGGVVPAIELWTRSIEERGYIGIRETEELDNYAQTAARLISAGLERSVVPIILSALPHSGFTRFGLRVERLTLGPAQELCEAQLTAFWDLAFIIDAGQVSAPG